MPTTLRTALWLTTYVFACLLGRLTVVEPFHVGLVWPAAGVGLVWLASSPDRRERLRAAGLLAVASAGCLAVTGGGAVPSLLALTFPLQPLLTLWLLRRWSPHLWGGGGRGLMTGLADFGRLLVAAALGAAALAVVRSALGVLLVPDETFSLALGRWARNATAMSTVGLVGLLLGGWVAERRDEGRPVFDRPSPGDALSGVALVATTAAIIVFGFGVRPDAPTSYMLTLAVVWAAVGFNPVLAKTHSLLTGAVAVWLTILGIGPIADIADPQARAAVAQLFVVILMSTGMVISLSRRQALLSVRRLEQSVGLAICRRVVERHGGTITVTDNPDGVGSCFELTLPTTSTAYSLATSR